MESTREGGFLGCRIGQIRDLRDDDGALWVDLVAGDCDGERLPMFTGGSLLSGMSMSTDPFSVDITVSGGQIVAESWNGEVGRRWKLGGVLVKLLTEKT